MNELDKERRRLQALKELLGMTAFAILIIALAAYIIING